MFDFSEIKDFDRHIEMSIPNYIGLIDVVSSIALEYLDYSSKIIDIGCSSGRLLNLISNSTKAELIGCDLVDMKYNKNYKFKKESAISVLADAANVSVITSIFTLQFMSKLDRAETLREVKRHIDGGAIAIIAEKVHLNSTRLDTSIYRSHMRKKLENFTADEILKKDNSLVGVMFPRSSIDIENELSMLGDYDQIWQSYNFKCWCIYK